MTHFAHRHILATKQFSREDVENIFLTANEMEAVLYGNKKSKLLEWKILASLFYEPSTRTRLSFESAMKRLGGEVITVADANSSSFSKGETLEDNARIISIYADAIVMRHPEEWSVERTANVIHIPVINAWDGSNEHPTQSLLDIYTILKEKGKIDGLKIAMVGDLRYGRTAHSLVYLASLFPWVSFTFIACERLKIPQTIKNFLIEKKISFKETTSYQQGIVEADVLYVTRVQRERFPSESEYQMEKDSFILTPDMLPLGREITILHPLPRVNEIHPDVDKLPCAAFFRQAQNGLLIRMALLYLLMK